MHRARRDRPQVQLQNQLRDRLEDELAGVLRGRRDSVHFCASPRPSSETVSTGIIEIDGLTGGVPKGQITELTGGISNGKTSLMLSILAGISGPDGGAVSGLIDPDNAFDPVSAAALGIRLESLLWIRGRIPGKTPLALPQILRIADLLIHGGGFGLIGVDLGTRPADALRRVPSSVWFRLRHAVENTPTILLFLTPEPTLKSTAALVLELDSGHADWTGRLLDALRPDVRMIRSRRHPVSGQEPRTFRLPALAAIEAGRTASDISRKFQGVTP